MTSNLDTAYRLAAARYGELGVDTEVALAQIAKIPVSLHCWQGDDVGGFEPSASTLSGGIAATGNYPGKAGTRRRAPRGRRQSAVAHPGTPSIQPARDVRRFRRAIRGPRCGGAGTFCRVDRLGEGAGDRARLQSHVLLAPARRRQLYPRASRPGRARLLDRARAGEPRGSPRRWDARWAHLRSRICGFRTA